MRGSTSNISIKPKQKILSNSSNRIIKTDKSKSGISKYGSQGIMRSSIDQTSNDDLNKLWEDFNKKYNLNSLENVIDQEFLRELDYFSKKHNIVFSSNLTMNNEAKYILSDVRYWIIFIHINLYQMSYDIIVQIFVHALNDHNIIDIEFFFEYFFIIVEKFSKVELLNIDAKSIPMKFIEIYKKNKEKIFKELNFSKKGMSLSENLEICDETNRVFFDEGGKKQNEFSFTQENDNKEDKISNKEYKEKTSNNELDQSLAGNFIWNDQIIEEESVLNLNIHLENHDKYEKSKKKVIGEEILEKFELKDESLIDKIIFDHDLEFNKMLNNVNESESILDKYLSPNVVDPKFERNISDSDNSQEVDKFLLEFQGLESPNVKTNNIKIVFKDKENHDFNNSDNNYQHELDNFHQVYKTCNQSSNFLSIQ